MAQATVLKPYNRLLLGFDLAGSNQMGDEKFLDARARIFPGAFRALQAVGLRRKGYKLQEAGDGGVLVVNPEVAAADLLTIAIPAMAAYVRNDNNPLRLRYTLHGGVVYRDHGRYWGGALNSAFRMLDSENLRTYLAHSGEEGVVAVSPHLAYDMYGKESSLTTAQQYLLGSWDRIMLHKKETIIHAFAAPLSQVVHLAGTYDMLPQQTAVDVSMPPASPVPAA